MARYCTKCGHEISDDAVVCIHCGCSTNTANKYVEQDSDSIGWGFLGFFVPLAGFILWLIWKDEAPKKARNLGIGALVALIISVVAGIGYGIFWVVVWGMAISDSGMAITASNAIIETIRTSVSALPLL